MQNAAEHGYEAGARGEIVLRAERHGAVLDVAVEDDGRGLPEDFDLDGATSLGLSIVRTLVESETGGHLTLGHAPDGGTRAAISLPVE
ncbi:ATP-binding protein [Nocardioides convexus]|uniref:ATP-binding protein n=1 Tax=Nocardioides convexus TaxID=2712224 RepID=UPI00310164F2